MSAVTRLTLGLALLVMVGGCVSAPPTATSPTSGSGRLSSSGAVRTVASSSGAVAPPGATLSADGELRAGELGSYTYNGAGSDSPWLPARALTAVRVAPGARLEVRLETGDLIGPWTAAIAPAADTGGSSARGIAQNRDPDARDAEIVIQAPRSGSWVLQVELSYAGASGSGAYYWLIDVR